MKINVLVPSFNHARYVEQTLRSIYSQTLKPAKLLVIDDGSSDDSPQIIERLLKQCPFDAEFIHRPNKGLTKTLNEGLSKLSDSEFFAYIGSDDIWFPKFLERRIDQLSKNPRASLAFGHSFVIDENNNITDSTADWVEFDESRILDHLLKGEIFASPSVVYRTDFLKKHKWNEDAALEDYELYLRLILESEFEFDPEILCAWRYHAYSTSRQFPKMMQEWINAQNRVLTGRIPQSELNEIQTRLRFKCVADYVRLGYKREAFQLFIHNLHGMTSLSQFLGLALRLLIPQKLFQANRRRKMRKKIRKYGNLNDYLANAMGS